MFLVFALIFSVLIGLIQSLKPFGYVSLISTIFIVIALISITLYNVGYIFDTEDDLRPRL